MKKKIRAQLFTMLILIKCVLGSERLKSKIKCEKTTTFKPTLIHHAKMIKCVLGTEKKYLIETLLLSTQIYGPVHETSVLIAFIWNTVNTSKVQIF